MTGNATKPRPLWMSLLVNMLAAFIVVALVQAFLVKVYRVPSASMEQTLQALEGGGDRMLVNRTAYLGGEPSRGDVVVFSRPDSWAGDMIGLGAADEQFLVKRVIAVEGDTVACCSSSEGKLIVNGVLLDEPYVFEDFPYNSDVLGCETAPRSLRCFPEYIVPMGQLLVLGDHRSQSSDSVVSCRSTTSPAPAPAAECVRTVPSSSVVGSVFLKVWPLHRIGTIS